MSKKGISIIVVIIVLIGGIIGWRSVRNTNQSPYETSVVQRGNLIQEVSATGKVVSPTMVNLQFKNSGKIILLNTEVGKKVVAGEILAKQDSSLLRSQLKQAQAVLKTQKYKLRSLEENKVPNHDDKYDVKAQEAIVEQALADIEVQMTKINETVLVAPIDGFVLASNSEVGEIAKPETVIALVASTGSLQIDVDIPETTIANVKVGQTVKIKLDAFDDATEWAGKVTDIDSAGTVKGGAIYYKTTVVFEEDDERIKSSMTANVWIKTAVSENTLFVPVSAIQKKDGKKIVQVLKEGVVTEKEVITGLKNDAGMIEIISGLSQGEEIVLGNKK